MKAGLVTGRGRFDLVEMPEPKVAPGVVVVDIALCGICGTDLHAYQSGNPYTPAVCGHEWTGTVREAGAGVETVGPGDRVVVAVPRACGVCAECAAGRTAWCHTTFLIATGRDALAPLHGGFAPSIAVAAERVVRLRDGLTDTQAAMIEPATVAVHAVRRTPVTLGATVVVQGCGPIGLLVLQCALAAGADQVIAIEPDPRRRRLASELGATIVAEPGTSLDTPVDIVFECAGVPSTIQSAVDLVRRGGTVNLVGLAAGAASIDPRMWLVKEVTVASSLAYQHEEFAITMDLVASGRLRLEPMHDRTVPLAEAAQAFAELAADPSSAVKLLVDPTA